MKRSGIKRKGKKPLPLAVRRYHERVRGLGCIVTGTPDPTIHHVHGGSCSAFTKPGMAQRSNDYLVIPLAAHLHCLSGGIDGGMGVLTWEDRYGTQLDFLMDVERELGVDVFELAGIPRPTVG